MCAINSSNAVFKELKAIVTKDLLRYWSMGCGKAHLCIIKWARREEVYKAFEVPGNESVMSDS